MEYVCRKLLISQRRACRVLGQARITQRRQPSSPSDEKRLTEEIIALATKYGRYGYRRVTEQLQHDGKVINHKRVLRLMRESDLLCRARRKRVKTTNSKHPFARYPNLIKGVVVNGMNQVWLADITYIRIRNGFVYLAAILDAYSRRVIGYAISTGLETYLTLKALRMAIGTRRPAPCVIHHSDQGCFRHNKRGPLLEKTAMKKGTT